MAGRKVRTKGGVVFENLSSKGASTPVSKPTTTPNPQETTNIKPPVNPQEVKQPTPIVEKNTADNISSGIGFNPLVENPVDEKAYTNNQPNQSTFTAEEIPEQQFQAPPIDVEAVPEPTIQDVEFEEPDTNGGYSGGGNNNGGGSADVDEPSDLTPKEKKAQSKMLAEVMLKGYQNYVPMFYKKIGKISDKKVSKLVTEGKINLNVGKRYQDGTVVTVGERLDAHNEAIEQCFVVSEEWVEEVRPPLERILAKKDWGISDEGIVMLKVVEHNATCIVQLVEIKKQMNEFLDAAMDMTSKSRTTVNTIVPPPPPPNTTNTAPVAPPPVSQPQPETAPMTTDVQVVNTPESIEDIEGDVHLEN